MESAESRLRNLLISSLEGDQAAYRTFLQETSTLLRGYVRRQLARSRRSDIDSEDIVQDALIAVHERRHTYERSLPVTAWLHAIARYKLIDTLRASARRKHVPLGETAELPEPKAKAAQDGLDVRHALERLPERFRTSIVLTKLDGLSVSEAASFTGMSEAAVKVNVHRGLKTLGRMFGRREREAQ